MNAVKQRAQHIEKKCEVCNVPFTCTIAKSSKRFCTKACHNVSMKMSMRGVNNPAYGVTYRNKLTHPEWVAKIAATQRSSDRMCGDRNPMRCAHIAAKMSQTRRERVTSDPAYREARSVDRRAAWAAGEYDHVSVGRCKWYAHVKLDGSTCNLQGTWEVALARRLDNLGVAYDAHKGRIAYLDSNGIKRSYYPDFYIPMWDAYVDVKGAFWNATQRDKVEAIRRSNPNMQLIIATSDTLSLWNVNVLATQRELLNVGRHNER